MAAQPEHATLCCPRSPSSTSQDLALTNCSRRRLAHKHDFGLHCALLLPVQFEACTEKQPTEFTKVYDVEVADRNGRLQIENNQVLSSDLNRTLNSEP